MSRDDRAIARHAARQGRAVSRAQVLASGGSPSWLRSQVRTRRWQRLWPGVYVTVTGPVGWMTRAHGALLYAGAGAVLGPQASAYLLGVTHRPPRVVDVLVPSDRRVTAQPGLSVSCGARPERTARCTPARLGLAPTVLALVDRARSADAVVGLICDGVRAGCSVDALRGEAGRWQRVRCRGLLQDLLADVAAGVESPLERRYQHGVERRHGLPTASLQVRQRVGAHWIRTDRVYTGRRVRVELDGRLAHPGGRTDQDCWRDNEVGISEHDLTLRYRWRHVAGSPCDTAAQVVRALRSRGWDGEPRRCGPSCRVR